MMYFDAFLKSKYWIWFCERVDAHILSWIRICAKTTIGVKSAQLNINYVVVLKRYIGVVLVFFIGDISDYIMMDFHNCITYLFQKYSSITIFHSKLFYHTKISPKHSLNIWLSFSSSWKLTLINQFLKALGESTFWTLKLEWIQLIFGKSIII